MKIKIILCLMLILGGNSFVFSDDQKIPASINSHSLTTEEEALRWAGEYKKADDEMNQVYQKLLVARGAKGQMALRKVQRAWIKFRDAQAEFVKQDWEGGSGQAAAVNSTLAVLTRDRVGELERLMP